MDDNKEDDGRSGATDDVFVRHARVLGTRAQSIERKGLEHLERGMYVSAVDALREVIDIYTKIGDETRADSARQYMALAMYEQGEVDEAVGIWEALIERGWDRPTTLNFLDLLLMGRYWMLPILLMSVVVGTFTIERLIGLRSSRVMRSGTMSQSIAMIQMRRNSRSSTLALRSCF